MANWLTSLLWPSPVVSLSIHGAVVDDEDDAFAVPLEAYTGTCHAVNAAELLTGTITIDTKGAKFHHSGVDLVVVEYLHFMDPFLSFDLSSISIHVADEGVIAGVSSLDFSVSLPAEMRRETYNGSAFSLRHRVEARVKQSWYNSDIYRYQFLYMFSISAPPSPATGNAAIHTSANLVLTCPSIAASSVALSCPYLDMIINVTDVNSPITNVYIMLLSGEFLNEEDEEPVNANVELVHHVFGAGSLSDGQNNRAETLSMVQGSDEDNTPLSKGYMTRKDVDVTNVRSVDPIIHGSVIETRVPLYFMPTQPSSSDTSSSHYFEYMNPACWPTTHRPPTLNIDAAAAADGSGVIPAAALKYFLRVVMEDAQGKRVWDAKEVILFRDEGPAAEMHSAPNRV